MDCPHCGSQVDIENCAYFNADQYSKPALVKTGCCGRGVWLTPIRSYRVTAYTGKEAVDHWGVPIKPT